MIKPRRPVLVTAADAALHLRLTFGIEVKPGTIRQWAARGKISSTGEGRCRFDLWEVQGYAIRSGLVGGRPDVV